MAKKTGTVKKKVVKVGALGNVYVHSTFNNVIITITNEVGDVISWSSAGKMGFSTDRFGRLRKGRLRHGPAQGESVCQGPGRRT